METNEHFYREEVERLRTQLRLLNQHVKALKEDNKEQRRLLEECWERIHYSGTWLTLCNGNIDGMKKHIDEIKKDGRYKELMKE